MVGGAAKDFGPAYLQVMTQCDGGINLILFGQSLGSVFHLLGDVAEDLVFELRFQEAVYTHRQGNAQ